MIRQLKVVFRRNAWTDLDQIFWYIVETTKLPRLAHSYVRRIEDRCRRLADAPHGGRLRSDLAPGLRTVPFERLAIICYVIEDDTVWITNVFRAGRDFEASLRGDGPSDDQDA